MIDINELRRLAQAATPGPWQFWHGWVATNIDSDGGTVIAERPTPSGGKYQARVDGNFRFIAAANPATVSELLDRLEVAEKERDALRTDKATLQHMAYSLKDQVEVTGKELESWKGLAQQFGNEADALRAKIERMERQEPAYWGPKHAIEGGCQTVIVGKFPLNPTDAPLYALPGAKGK